MKLSKRLKFTLFILLIALCIILRYPTTPHEIGWDSFTIHILANSISTFGYANWWVHPLSIIGAFPNSEVSAVPFILSGVSLSTNMNMESVILLFSLVLGFFSIFVAYLVAGVIWDNDIFKFLVAFVFSTSQGIMTFSTWTAPTRPLFVVLLPLFIYMILKSRIFKVRLGVLTLFFLILLIATHQLVYFTVPIIISYFCIILFYKLGKYIKSTNIKISENFVNIAIFAIFFVMFSSQFFTRTFMEQIPRGYGGSRYEFLLTSFLSAYGRYIGVLIIFVVGGYIYLSLKHNKRFEEWFLLLSLVALAPLLYIVTYMKWVIPSFAALLIGIGLTNVAKVSEQKKKYVSSFIVIVLLLSIIFGGYYQYLHFLDDPRPEKRYMEERTYAGALWIKDNVNKAMVGGGGIASVRAFAISQVPTLTGMGTQDMTYGFTKIGDLNISKNSPLSIEFYRNGPYVRTPHTLHTGYYVSRLIEVESFDSSKGKEIISKFNLSYVVENKEIDNTFIYSVRREKNNVYDNGKIRVWDLD